MSKLFVSIFTLAATLVFAGCGLTTDDITLSKQWGAKAGERDAQYLNKCLHPTPRWNPLIKETEATLRAYRQSYLAACSETLSRLRR